MAMTRKQAAGGLRRSGPAWGGWVVGPPTSVGGIRPRRLRIRRIRRSTGICPTPSARLIRRLEHVDRHRAAADRGPVTHRQGKLDAGADAVIIAMVSPPNRRPPRWRPPAMPRQACAASDRYGRVSVTTRPYRGARQRVRDDRNCARIGGLNEIVAVPGLAGLTSVPPTWRSPWGMGWRSGPSPVTAPWRASRRWRRRQAWSRASTRVTARSETPWLRGGPDDNPGLGITGAAAWRYRTPQGGGRVACRRRPRGRVRLMASTERVAGHRCRARQGAAIVKRLSSDGVRVAACDLLADELTSSIEGSTIP